MKDSNPNVLAAAVQLIRDNTSDLVVPVICKDYSKTRNLNCWGFTARAMGWIEYDAWLGNHKMRKLLVKNTVEVSSPSIGDVVIFENEQYTEFYGDSLNHTAILLNPGTNQVLHKPGVLPVCVESLESVINRYGQAKFVRSIKLIGQE